jgi:hypothetical protein
MEGSQNTGEYLGPEMSTRLREKYSEIGRTEVKHPSYVVVVADDTYAEDWQSTIAKIVPIFVKHPATARNITSSLLVA